MIASLRLLLVATLLTGACGRRELDKQSRDAIKLQRINAVTDEIARMGQEDFPGKTCGPASVAGANIVVFATADACLSCLEVGAFLRDVTRRGVSVPDRIVVTPAGDVDEVCEYLRREKALWRVAGIPEERLPISRMPQGIVYIETEPDGVIRRLEHATTPLELAELVFPRADGGMSANP